MRRLRWLLISLLTGSFLLRLALILRGGSGYWPDEVRYEASRAAAYWLSQGEWVRALGAVHSPDHLLFRILGIVPAWLQLKLGLGLGLPALFFSLFSVLNLYLLFRLARRLGAKPQVALLATALMAGATSLFFYSRHVVPYDLSLSFGLSAVLVALRRTGRLRDDGLCGLLALACFLSYNGYWSVALVAFLVGLRQGGADWPSRFKRLSVRALGFCLPLGLVVGLSRLRGGHLLAEMVLFSQTVRSGDFSEGWRLPLAYLWHAEHGLLLVLLGGLVLALLPRFRSAPATFGLAVFLFLYGLLGLVSAQLELFVVYGRLARQLVPFLCLAAAPALWGLFEETRRRRLALWIVAVAVSQIAFNFAGPLGQQFPDLFRHRAMALVEESSQGHLGLIYSQFGYPVPSQLDLPAHRELLRSSHPLQFKPYQYEGLLAAERRSLRTLDLSMRLVLWHEESPDLDRFSAVVERP